MCARHLLKMRESANDQPRSRNRRIKCESCGAQHPLGVECAFCGEMPARERVDEFEEIASL